MKRFLPLLLFLSIALSQVSYKGDKWEGEFENGKPLNGKGIFHFPLSGDKYDAIKNPTRNLQNIYFGIIMGLSAIIPTSIHFITSSESILYGHE